MVRAIFIGGKLKGLSWSYGFSGNNIFIGLTIGAYRLFVFLMGTIVLLRRLLFQDVVGIKPIGTNCAYAFASFGLKQRP